MQSEGLRPVSAPRIPGKAQEEGPLQAGGRGVPGIGGYGRRCPFDGRGDGVHAPVGEGLQESGGRCIFTEHPLVDEDRGQHPPVREGASYHLALRGRTQGGPSRQAGPRDSQPGDAFIQPGTVRDGGPCHRHAQGPDGRPGPSCSGGVQDIRCCGDVRQRMGEVQPVRRAM